jgi:peptidoglycan/xylan/chitin deacetylase (PgdA/CDA1 family)
MTSFNPYRLAAKVCRQPVWHFKPEGRSLFLTFDDGPSPALTPWILDVLQSYDARATFFCLGRQVQQHPELYRAILNDGHAVGNHTHHHPDGWRTSLRRYLEDVDRASQWIQTPLFRPPHGRLGFRQMHDLAKTYRIVMWDVMSKDYDTRLSPQTILKKLKRRVRPGSIVVFHDSPKSEKNLRTVLPKFLDFCQTEGYQLQNLNF